MIPLRRPEPTDPPASLYEQARIQHAVIERIKQHVGLWKSDKRLRIAGEILLRDIETFEREEAARPP